MSINKYNDFMENNLSNDLFEEFTSKLEKSNCYKKLFNAPKNFFVCVCQNCIPIINRVTYNDITITTICPLITEEEYTINYIYDNFLQDINEDFRQCQKHYKEFDYYCDNCHQHLCEECAHGSNEHEDHDVIILDNEIDNNMTSNIKEIIDGRVDIDIRLKRIFSTIYDNYLSNNRYFSYSIIFNAFSYFLDQH